MAGCSWPMITWPSAPASAEKTSATRSAIIRPISVQQKMRARLNLPRHFHDDPALRQQRRQMNIVIAKHEANAGRASRPR